MQQFRKALALGDYHPASHEEIIQAVQGILREQLHHASLEMTNPKVVKESLRLGATAVILSHNHPSGCAEASRPDQNLTTHLKAALALVDARLIDHIIVAGEKTLSFAETGLL